MTTQKEMVKYYIGKYGSITTWQAFQDLGILDLQSVIRCLRREGFDIRDKKMYATNRYGRNVNFKKYFFPKENVFKKFAEKFF